MREWTELLGSDFQRLGLFRRRGRLSTVYRPGPAGRLIPHRVHRHSDDDIIGIDDEGEEVVLDHEGTIGWDVDWDAVRSKLCAGLSLEALDQAVAGHGRSWRLGRCELIEERSVEVHLVAETNPAARVAALRTIAATASFAGVVLLPTLERITGSILDVMRERDLVPVSMADRIDLHQSGNLVALPHRDALFREIVDKLGITLDSGPQYVLHRVGKAWDVTFEGETRRVDHQKGMSYLVFYLLQRDEQVDPIDVVATLSGRDPKEFWGDTGPVNDKKARAQYLAAMLRIKEELDDPDMPLSLEREEKLRSDFEALAAEVRAGEALGGGDRIRPVGERIARRVGTAIQRLLDALDDEESGFPAFAAHVRAGIPNLFARQQRYGVNAVTWESSRAM